MRAAYEGIHSYRHNAKLLLFVTAVTLVLQAMRVVSIWAGGEAVGVNLSIRPTSRSGRSSSWSCSCRSRSTALPYASRFS